MTKQHLSGAFSRRRFLTQLAGVAAAAGGARAAASRPNVVFLLADDQRWDALGCMGNPIIRTPNIDRLSAEGVTFTNHFVTTSICMTSRASIFTGLYARCHGIHDFAKPFSANQLARTYPMLMRQAGYHTGFIGKYGVGNKMPEEHFDYWRGFPGQGQYYTKKDGKFIHLTRLMGEQASEFLAGAPKDKPFCLSVSFKAPHVQDEDPRQFLYDPEHADWYKDIRIPEPKKSDPKFISALPTSVHRSENRRRWAVRFSTPELYQESVKAYYRLITEVDLVVGRVRHELDRLGVAKNTVIVYSADNGFYLGERGLAGKWLMHEESIRTPLIVYDPRLPATRLGKRQDAMTLNIDIAPTLLEAAGLEAPKGMQGRSVYSLIHGTAKNWRKEFFYEHLFDAKGWIAPTEGVRTESWKYTIYTQEKPPFEELYDLRNDPEELTNLASKPQSQGRLEEMRARREAWLKSLAAWRQDQEWKEPV